MKKIVLVLASLSMFSVCHAFDPNLTNNPNTYPKVVTCSTTTATSLFSDDAITGVIYDNQTSGTIYISTYAATSVTATNVYGIPTGRQPLYIPANNHYYGLAASTTNAKINLIIVK